MAMTFEGNQAYEAMKPTTVGRVEAVVFETFHCAYNVLDEHRESVHDQTD